MQPVEVYVWIAAAAAVLLALMVAFVWVLMRRTVPWVERAYAHYCGRIDLESPVGVRSPRDWTRCVSLHAVYSLAAWALFCVAAVVAYEVVSWWPGAEPLVRLDREIHAAVDGRMGDTAVFLLANITTLADVLTVVILASVVGVLLWWYGHWWLFWALGMDIVGGMAVVWGLKRYTDRVRPEGGLVGVAGEAFPSGHASLSMMMYGFLIYLVWRLLENMAGRVVLTTLLAGLILTIGMSRILLSVHWVSDVVGGFVVGMAWLLYSIGTVRLLRDSCRVGVQSAREMADG